MRDSWLRLPPNFISHQPYQHNPHPPSAPRRAFGKPATRPCCSPLSTSYSVFYRIFSKLHCCASSYCGNSEFISNDFPVVCHYASAGILFSLDPFGSWTCSVVILPSSFGPCRSMIQKGCVVSGSQTFRSSFRSDHCSFWGVVTGPDGITPPFMKYFGLMQVT